MYANDPGLVKPSRLKSWLGRNHREETGAASDDQYGDEIWSEGTETGGVVKCVVEAGAVCCGLCDDV